MKPFRRHVALAVDGGGIRGTMVARALAVVEQMLGQPCCDLFELLAGTSTGSIISASIAMRLPASKIHSLYVRLGDTIFRKSWRTLWPLARYKYPNEPLIDALRDVTGEHTMSDFWRGAYRRDVVITVRDLVENRTRFVKPWKQEYRDWKVWYAVLCSCTVPTYFPVVDGRYVDGGVGAYSNPCYLAAYEAVHCLQWPAEDTTLISLGTGRVPTGFLPGEAGRLNPLQWIMPLVDTFLGDACDQQVRLTQKAFPNLDLRRFQIDLPSPIATDDPGGIPALTRLGTHLGRMILEDQVDTQVVRPAGFAAQQQAE